MDFGSPKFREQGVNNFITHIFGLYHKIKYLAIKNIVTHLLIHSVIILVKEVRTLELQSNPTVIELDMRKMAKANLWSTIILTVLFIAINSLIHQRFSLSITFWSFIIFCIGYVLLIILHELFHLIGFVLFGRVKIKELDYGLNLKLGVAYATTTKPLKNHVMRKALLLPFWTTGALPAVIGFAMDSYLIVMLGAFLIAGAIGDFYMYKELKKYPNDCLIKDDPELPRLYVYHHN